MTDSDLLAPSEEAIEAAREASAHTAELGMADRLLPRRAMMASLRAAYAIDLAPLAARIRELEDALHEGLNADGVTPDDAPPEIDNAGASAWVAGYEAGQNSVADPIAAALRGKRDA